MHTIMVVNAKGGCGKTTIATTLASYFSMNGYKTALMDFDPQKSSSQWLELRTEDLPEIRPIDATRPAIGTTRTWQLYSGQGTDIVIKDTPAGIGGSRLIDLFNRADTILIPVMSSIIDLNAVEGFITEIQRLSRMGAKNKRIGLVANRARINTKSYQGIKELAERTGIPLVATLRDTQNYPIAMESGMGILEFNKHSSSKDRKQIQVLVDWLHEEVPEVESPVERVESTDRSWNNQALPPFAVG